MSGFELVSYEPAFRDDYLRLLREAWGAQAMSEQEFDWWFMRNPAGSLMSMARMDGRVVGVAAHSLYRMVLDGEEQLASFSVHATTHESARGRGIFAELERKHEREAVERGVACVLAFASPPTAPIFLGPLGWTEIARLRVWARPTSGRSVGDTAGGLDVDGDAGRTWPNHVIRDMVYVKWRYIDSPRRYEPVSAGRGYGFVWPEKLHKGRRIAVLADLAGSEEQIGRLLRRAAQRARAHLLFALPAPEQRRAFLLAGFVPTPVTLHFMGKALAGKLNTDLRAWRLTLGDTDFF